VGADGVEQRRHEIRMVQAVLDQILPQVVVLLLHAKVDGLPQAHHTSGFISRSQGWAVQVVLRLVFHGMIDGWQVVHGVMVYMVHVLGVLSG